MPPPVDFTTSRTRDEHIDDHKWLHRRLQDCFYSADYPTLQAAIDAATGRANTDNAAPASATRPLVIAPGLHQITEPLRINSVENLHVFAYGARIRALADMPCLLQANGVAHSSFHGLRLETDNEHTVQDMLYLYHDLATASRTTTQVKFYDFHCGGKYVNGVRIGKVGSATQCDQISFYSPFLAGNWDVGEETLWQRGMIFGTGVHANNLSHSVYMLGASRHRAHVEVDATQLAVYGMCSAVSEVDFVVATTMYFRADGVRSEGAGRLLDLGGAASFACQCLLSDVDWHAEQLPADGRYIVSGKGGALILDNVRVINPSANTVPNIRCTPPVPATILARGLTAGGGNPAPIEEAFDVGVNVSVLAQAYTEIGAGGAIKSVTAEYRLP